MDLKERIRNWPGVVPYRLEKIEEVLLDFEARLIELEPKKEEPAPEPIAALEPPAPEPAPLTPKPVANTMTFANPLDGERTDN